MLGASRIVSQGETAYAHEREGIDFIIKALPNRDPFYMWSLLELLDPSTGRLYEIDALVLGESALYLVEIKSGPGRYEGDFQDWYRISPDDGRRRYMDAPLSLANHKAKILKSLIRSKMKEPNRAPRIEALVFLSAEDVTLAFRNHGNQHVVTRKTLLKALAMHQFPGAPSHWRNARINKPLARDVGQAIAALGLKPRKGKAHVGSYELREVLTEGPGFQDRAAVHRTQEKFTCRARIYAVPQQTSVERRQRLLRAADREAQLLWDVRDHPNVLRVVDVVSDAPLGPTVLFDSFDDGVPLDVFLRENPNLSFEERIEIIGQIGRALAHCHKRQVIHGALSPHAVLVRRGAKGAIETRLYNFQLGTSQRAQATTHWSALASESWMIYQAPELREGSAALSPASDVFSLGALTYYVLTGRAPGETFADVSITLSKLGCLDPSIIDDAVPSQVADLVRHATAVSSLNRIDDAGEWVDMLLEELTAPQVETVAEERDPLEARAEDILDKDLIVEGVLGHGATSRVLQVLRESDNRSYALKVSATPEHDERLTAEADTLASLRHARIVQLVDRRTIKGRSCLLLSLAGTMTLHRYLQREGPVSLDLAARYGEELIGALEHLEDLQILHRDIKPANLGVGIVGKQASHLTLFDFSLAKTPLTELNVGTAAYRDPYLSLRGAWDNAAERYSAAVTLHEMLTGVRPRIGEEGQSALDEDALLVVASERFDPAIRESLTKFFERALDHDAEVRFASSEEMRKAWLKVLEVPGARDATTGKVDATEASLHPTAVGDPSQLTEAELAAIKPSTRIDALPLSARARNALDRAGMVKADDLRALADNRLSAIRGIGRAVAQEILGFRNRWIHAIHAAPTKAKPFFPGYQGEDLSVATIGIEPKLAEALLDAGFGTLPQLAAAPATQVKELAKRTHVDVKALEEVVRRENESGAERSHPTTIEGWLDTLLPTRKKSTRHIRALYGLAEPFLGRLDVPVREVAKAKNVTRANIYLVLGRCREEWASHGGLEHLRSICHRLIADAGGAMPLGEAGAQLLTLISHEREGVTPEERRARGAALFRVVTEVERDDQSGLHYVRLHDNSPWVCATEQYVSVLRDLGKAADELAARPVLASSGEAARTLAQVAEGTALAHLSAQRLTELAAAAAKEAALSARLEIYPKGMPPDRALALSTSTLRGPLTPEEVHKRVALRYPEAEPLPDPPKLHELLEAQGLLWHKAEGLYVRSGELAPTTMGTRFSTVDRARTALPSQSLSMKADAVEARQFDTQLRNAVERRSLRILGVGAERAQQAALALSERLGVPPVAFDKKLIAAIREQMKAKKIEKEEIIHRADLEGPSGKAWGKLQKLVAAATKQVSEDLLPPAEPLLLVQPGLIARYELTGFLDALVESSKQADSAAILLLVPSVDSGGIPRINGELVIPGVMKSQALWVSREWLANRHNEAA